MSDINQMYEIPSGNRQDRRQEDATEFQEFLAGKIDGSFPPDGPKPYASCVDMTTILTKSCR